MLLRKSESTAVFAIVFISVFLDDFGILNFSLEELDLAMIKLRLDLDEPLLLMKFGLILQNYIVFYGFV